MQMTFRWYGKNNDAISLESIKQIPGMAGVVWALHDMPAGEIWPLEHIMQVKHYVESYGLHIDVVESVNVHEDIKLGLPSRDRYIAHYQETMRRLFKAGVKVICYNFMPIFDWTRTDLFRPMDDGATALFFEKAKVMDIEPKDLIQKILQGSGKYTMPGWEPERLSHIHTLFQAYEHMSTEQYWDNARYFLEHIIPVAEECNIKMAIHPDDPPWSIFGLPRIITCAENIARFLHLVESPYNGLTFCTGSLGVSRDNDLPAMIRTFGDSIHFAHIRNVRIYDNGDFIETAHRSSDGAVNIPEVVKAYHDIGFTGYARPDHGRHIWGEETDCRPGYGLYDRALGAMYILGLWDAFSL